MSDYTVSYVRAGPPSAWHGYGTLTHLPTGLHRTFYESYCDRSDRERAQRELEFEVGNLLQRPSRERKFAGVNQSDPVHAAAVRDLQKLGKLP
jgi:hypothetical protein